TQYARAIEILKKHEEQLRQLANKLLTSEVIFKEDLIEIFGKRPWDPEEEHVIPFEESNTEEVVEELSSESEAISEESTEVESNAKTEESSSDDEDSDTDKQDQ
ncbi:MAG: peptidase M41, partial [Bacteroidetes bacterium]